MPHNWRLASLWPALPALLFVPVVLAPPVNHDVAAILAFSQRWLGGERLYTDLIDVNPPLVFVLNLIPAELARLTGIGAVPALQLCLLVLGFALWWLALRVRDRAAEGPVERVLLDVLPGLVTFAAGYDFGQRDTLMAAAGIPYLFAAARREGGARPRARHATAVLAALGFALKPHFLGIPVLVELALLIGRARRLGWRAGWAESWRDPVPWVMAAVWLLYAAALPLVFPRYLGVVVPLVWSLYLEQGGLTMLGVLLVPRLACAVLLLVPGVWLAFRPGWPPAGALPRLLGLAGLGALASAMVQHKGWSYHIVPVEMFACALAALLAARWLDAIAAWRHGGARRIAAMLAALFALFCVEAGEAPWNEIGYRDSDTARLTALLRKYAEGRPVLVLSPAITPIYPALNYAHARLTLKAMNMWMLEGAYQTCPAHGERYRQPSEMGAVERQVYQGVAEDFARAPPPVALVDIIPGIPWCGSEFSFIAYFSRDKLFAETWKRYRLVESWDRYRFYVREGS
jgi:hypothetical protein